MVFRSCSLNWYKVSIDFVINSQILIQTFIRRYKWLDAFYSGKSLKIVLTKLFADQFILTPPLIMLFFISSYSYVLHKKNSLIFTPRSIIFLNLAGMSLMEAKSDILRECRVKFLHTFQVRFLSSSAKIILWESCNLVLFFQTSCGYWLPVQFINFMLIPAYLRVTYVSVASFCWVNILCYLKNVPTVEHKKINHWNLIHTY